MNAPASLRPLNPTPGPDPVPVTDEELAQLAPEPVELDILEPENLDAYLAKLEADEADPNKPGAVSAFLSGAANAAVELVDSFKTAGVLTGQNAMAAAGGALALDGQQFKDAARRQTALGVQAAAMFAGTYPMIGETVKGAFKEVGTKLGQGYQDTPENRRKVAAVRQARDRALRDINNLTDSALVIADHVVGGLDLRNAYSETETQDMMKAAGGMAEVGDLAFGLGVAKGAKLGQKLAAAGARAAEKAATTAGADKVADLIQSTTKYAGSLQDRFYRAAAAAADSKVPNFGALSSAASKVAQLQDERLVLEAAADSAERTAALTQNAARISEQKAVIEKIQADFTRRADEAALAANTRPVSQTIAGGAIQLGGDAMTAVGRKGQAAVDWLRDKRSSALGTSDEAVRLGDEVVERATGVSPGLVERTAGWVADLGENVSAAGRLMRTAESSTPYFQRLAKETDGWTRFAAQNANRVEFISRLGRGAAEATDGAFRGGAQGAIFGLLQGDPAEGAGEGFLGGFFGGSLRTIRLETDPGAVRARQIGDIAEARSRRAGLQQRLFDEAPRNVQLAAATFEATNPNLIVDFVRQKGSGGSYVVNPDGTGTATIDLDSRIALAPLLAHEVTHHIARNPDISADLRRRFLGDEAAGKPGYFTELKDGKLQPKADFAAFRDEYLAKLRDAGKDTAAYEANPELILHEVIAEAGVASLLATNNAGEFAGIGALRRKARPLVPLVERFARSEMVMNSSVLQRALMATGAVFREDGRFADGTGLFETDMSPELRSAVKQVIREYDLMNLSERTGQVESFSETPTIYSEQELVSNPELMDLVSSGFDVDIDPATGKRKFLTAREAKQREQEFIDDLILALDASPDISPGRVRAVTTKDGRTIYSGKYIPADVLESLQSKNKYNPRQLEMLAMLTDTLAKRPGTEAHFVYQPAMTRGSRLYKQRAVTNRVETPISILISRTGGVLVNTISQEKVLRNLDFFARKGLLGSWGGDVRAARADLLKYIDNTVAGREGAEGLGLEKRDALNALFGQLAQVQKDRNPVLQGMSDAQGRKLGVVQSRRLDRINQMRILDSEFRANYDRVSQNLRPEVLPVPERFTGTGEEGDRQSTKVDAPGFLKRFDIQEYTKGGKYFDLASGEDVTGRVYESGSIDVSTGKPSLQASDTQVEAATSGRKIRTNLFKQSAGWKWVGEAPAKTSTLVSVEMGSDHLYTLNAQFDTPIEMARYEDKKSEPRLRPTTRGVLRVGEKVGEIEVRGRTHPVYDSITTATYEPGQGKADIQYRPEQVETPEFKRWFGDSKVVDEDGKPLVVYHGTHSKFTVFEPGRAGAMYFTPNRKMARSGYGPNVIDAYLRIRKLADLTDPNTDAYKLAVKTFNEQGGWSNNEDAMDGRKTPNFDPSIDHTWEIFDNPETDIWSAFDEEGYDGVKLQEYDGNVSYGVFDPTQIKSATKNRGTFDPNNPDIQYRPDEMGFYSQLERTLAAIPEKASRQQIEAALRDGVKEKGQLKERPVKKEEMEDVRDVTGLSFAAWMQANPQATREQMLDFARENRVRVSRTVNNEGENYILTVDGQRDPRLTFDSVSDLSDYIDESVDAFKREFSLKPNEMRDPAGNVLFKVEEKEGLLLIFDGQSGELAAVKRDQRGVQHYFNEILRTYLRSERDRYNYDSNSNAPRFREYSTKGGENYAEHVLTLPSPKQSGAFGRIEFPDGYSVEGFLVDISASGLEHADYGRLDDSNVVEFNNLTKSQLNAFQDNAQSYSGEVQITKENSSTGSDYTSSHFPDVDSYLAHIRTTEQKTANGDRVYLVEEIQSDLHQEGRDLGYKQSSDKLDTTGWSVVRRAEGDYADGVYVQTPLGQIPAGRSRGNLEQFDGVSDAQIIAQTAERLLEDKNQGKLPDAPFKKTWHEMAFKYGLQQAVQAGAEYLAWPTGETQVRRFPSSFSVVSKMVWDTGPTVKELELFKKSGGSIPLGVLEDGTVLSQDARFDGKRLSEIVGKEPAARILAEPDGTLSPGDLTLGGQGMRGFYDGIVPQFADKYLKKYGVKTEDITVLANKKMPVGGFEETAEILGVPLAELQAMDFDTRMMMLRNAQDKISSTKVHAVRITPELRNDIRTHGQAMYRPETPSAAPDGTPATPQKPKIVGARRTPIKASGISYENITVPKIGRSLPKAVLENSPQDLFDRIDTAKAKINDDPLRLADERGYVEYFKDAGVWGDVLTAPPALRMLLERPQEYVDLLNGGYHGRLTKPGTMDAADAGLDATVEMRAAINGRPPEMITAMHHLWGILSRMLPPVEQEAAWLRLVSRPEILAEIQSSIDGTYDRTHDQWKAIVSQAMSVSNEAAQGRGNQGTANANAFYLMLSNWNGKWNRVSDIYTANNSSESGRRFWSLGAGPVGIKNKVQRFIGLTFGIPALIMDRWKFVEFYYQQFGKSPQDYFKYSAFGTPEDPNGIYGVYGALEGGNSAFSLAFYEGIETALGRAIANSKELTTALGRHANLGGLHWKGWNAIKNEAVGHSSLDLTYDLALASKNPTVDDVLAQIGRKDYYTEGLVGNRILRFTLPKP